MKSRSSLTNRTTQKNKMTMPGIISPASNKKEDSQMTREQKIKRIIEALQADSPSDIIIDIIYGVLFR